jgi:hypothetical protein
MPSPVYQNMVNLIVSLSIRRCAFDRFLDVAKFPTLVTLSVLPHPYQFLGTNNENVFLQTQLENWIYDLGKLSPSVQLTLVTDV